MASAVTVVGLTVAKACSQPGNVAMVTTVELVKMSGIAACRTPMPTDSGWNGMERVLPHGGTAMSRHGTPIDSTSDHLAGIDPSGAVEWRRFGIEHCSS
jgi:hypothetical protein